MNEEMSDMPNDKEHLRILLRLFASVLIQIRKDTNQNGETGLNAIAFTETNLYRQIENYIESSVEELTQDDSL